MPKLFGTVLIASGNRQLNLVRPLSKITGGNRLLDREIVCTVRPGSVNVTCETSVEVSKTKMNMVMIPKCKCKPYNSEFLIMNLFLKQMVPLSVPSRLGKINYIIWKCQSWPQKGIEVDFTSWQWKWEISVSNIWQRNQSWNVLYLLDLAPCDFFI